MNPCTTKLFHNRNWLQNVYFVGHMMYKLKNQIAEKCKGAITELETVLPVSIYDARTRIV